jgi:hypothetical protein
MQAQFADGSISGWDLELNVCSINGTQFPARPTPDAPAFSFPTMPSGAPGLKLHPGKYWMLALDKNNPAHNETNKYFLTKMVDTKGGVVSLKCYCPKANNGFMSIYVKTDKLDEIGVGNQVATGWGTKWMDLKFTIPAGKCKITLFMSGDATQSGSDMSIDSFLLPA